MSAPATRLGGHPGEVLVKLAKGRILQTRSPFPAPDPVLDPLRGRGGRHSSHWRGPKFEAFAFVIKHVCLKPSEVSKRLS